MKRLKGAETPLEKRVQKIINEKADDYDNGAEGVINDILQYGCGSGMIGELVYYHDTLAFYKEHEEEIDALLKELCDDCGTTPAGIFGDKWDAADFFAKETTNQNLLAWFGFEETARRLAERNGMEV